MKTLIKKCKNFNKGNIKHIYIIQLTFLHFNIAVKHAHIRNGIKILQANEHSVDFLQNIFFQLLDLFPFTI